MILIGSWRCCATELCRIAYRSSICHEHFTMQFSLCMHWLNNAWSHSKSKRVFARSGKPGKSQSVLLDTLGIKYVINCLTAWICRWRNDCAWHSRFDKSWQSLLIWDRLYTTKCTRDTLGSDLNCQILPRFHVIQISYLLEFYGFLIDNEIST